MNKNEQEIEIKTSKKKSVFIILGSVVFVVLCVHLFLRAESNHTYPPLLLEVVAIIGVLFFGLGLILGIRKKLITFDTII